MTATIILVRHAAHSQLEHVLCGRAGDVPLSEAGSAQALRLARRLGGEGVDEVQTSPVRRARETAQALTMVRRAPVTVAEALDEVDFGEWTGREFAALEGDPRWREWNARRGAARAPGGEAMVAVQERVLAHLRAVARRAEGLVVAMVSHADVIRAAVAGVLGLSLDRILAFDIDPASVTRIAAGPWGERVLSLNERTA
ncbi:histidine phosphatase family protein [Porphyrobacter sp. CACIAM 03H1]|uniref:histidine phosphatase family protein n=1 Tax=Porphyrobacter sp. CACIAM 03H1 TaxID=2003315 RepID=UPI000B5A3638|nr:histidine phosphatase family protein [Porphyrobacter sp. CACIAM 03H1]ASJ90462.1 histidine phosphatase family protein [Porphyrobacter sp. CACIAM 03H1]